MEEFEFVEKKGFDFIDNLWVSFQGFPPQKRRFTESELVWMANKLSDKWIYFLWDGEEQ